MDRPIHRSEEEERDRSGRIVHSSRPTRWEDERFGIRQDLQTSDTTQPADYSFSRRDRDRSERSRSDRDRYISDRRGFDRYDRSRHDRERYDRSRRDDIRDRDRYDRYDRERRDNDRPERRDRFRRRSRSPRRHREREIDESDVDWDSIEPIENRPRIHSKWDVKPPGYEDVTADQAKMSGLFPLPGAPRNVTMDPEKLKRFAEENKNAIPVVPKLEPINARQSRRLHISNLPDGVGEADVLAWFNDLMNELNGTSGSNSASLCHIVQEKAEVLVEFRSSEDATLALYLFDGSHLRGSKILVARPDGYIQPNLEEDSEETSENDRSNLDRSPLSDNVEDSPNKLVLSNIPATLHEQQVVELLTAFGPLKSFILIRDRGNNESRGIALFVFRRRSDAEAAIKGLDSMELSGHSLRIRFTCEGSGEPHVAAAEDRGISRVLALLRDAPVSKPSNVLQLFNMIVSEELQDLSDYQDIIDEIRSECEKSGHVRDIKIPRPTGGTRLNYGVGKVYVHFEDIKSAERAFQELAGRKFADRTIIVSYFPLINFETSMW